MPTSEWFLGNDPSGAVAWTETVVERGTSFSFTIKTVVSRALPLTYAIRTSAARTHPMSFAIKGPVALSQNFLYTIVGGIGRSLAQTYAIKGQLGSNLLGAYSIASYVGGGAGNNAPGNLTVSLTGGSNATIAWTTDVAKDSYKVYVAPTLTGPFTLQQTVVSPLSYNYTGLLPATPVYFTVSALLLGAESARVQPAVLGIIPPAINVVDGDDVIATWPITVTGIAGPSQQVTVTLGAAAKVVTSAVNGTFSATFASTDGVTNGSYSMQVTAQYGVNQNITANRTVSVNTAVTPPPPSNEAIQFWFFMGH